MGHLPTPPPAPLFGQAWIQPSRQVKGKPRLPIPTVWATTWPFLDPHPCQNLVRQDSDLDVHTRLEGGGSDLLDHLAGRVQVNQTLVDAELVVVPGLRTLTARRLTGGVAEHLGGKTDGALDVELLVLRAVHKVAAHYNVSRGNTYSSRGSSRCAK